MPPTILRRAGVAGQPDQRVARTQSTGRERAQQVLGRLIDEAADLHDRAVSLGVRVRAQQR